MSKNISNPTYEELLQISKNQELEIDRLHKLENQITNFDFYINQSIDLVCVAGVDGFYKEINETFIKTFGFTKSEILSKNLLEFIHPEDLEGSIKIMEDLKLGNNSINFENRIIKKDGEYVTIKWRTSVDLSSNLIYAIGRDVNETRKIQNSLATNERLLNDAQKLAKMGSWEYSYENHNLIWSNELYSIYEIEKKPNQNLLKVYEERFSNEEVLFFQKKIDQSVVDKIPFEIELMAKFPDGRTKWLNIYVIPVIDSNGNVVSLRGNTQDITQKKQTEYTIKEKDKEQEELKLKLIEEESNAKFRSYIENAPNGILVTDENGKFIEANLAATLITGYAKNELLAMNIKDLTAEDSIEYLNGCFSTLKKTGAVNGEFKTIHKSGEIRWRSVNAVKISETQFMAFIKDVTDIKRVNELLTNTFERITDAFVALDRNWCYTYMNKKAGEILGRNPVEMIGKNIWKEFPTAINGDFYKACHQSIDTQEYSHLEDYHGSSKRWVENHIYPSVDGISNFFRDITEEKLINNKIEENEKQFRALVENNEGIITVIDEDLKVIFRSTSSARVTGYSDFEFNNIQAKDYYHPDSLEYVRDKIQKAIENPNTAIPVLFQVRHREGNYIWLEGVLNNMLNDSSVKGIVANLRDVTDRKAVIEALTSERDKFAKIAATSPGLIYSMRQNKDGSLSYPYASDAIVDIYGLTFEEVEKDSNRIFELIHSEDIDDVIAKIIKTKTTMVPLKGEYRYFHPTKGLVWHEVNSLPVVEPEGTVICHGIITDITERIVAEQKIIKANRLYLFISQINQMIVRTTDEETLFKEACTIAVEIGKFKMAWIGKIDETNNSVLPVMIAGEHKGYQELLKNIKIDSKTQKANGPAALAIRDNKIVVCNDIEHDVLMDKWKEEALSRGYKSLMVLPIRKFQKVIGLFTFYSSEKDFFDNQEILLLEEATGDVSFALEVFEKEIQNKKAEEAIFESEHRYHTLTEVSPVGIFRTDPTGYTTFVNPSWSEISGLPFERALGNGWLDAVHEEDRKAILNGWENATIKNEKSLSEYRFVRPDGSLAWVMGQAIPEKNSENEVVGYIGTITDITELKKGEEDFKKVNKKLEGILDAIPDLLFEVGIDGHFYNFHSHHNNMLALPESEFIGRKFSDVLPKDVADISLLAVQEAALNGFSMGRQYTLEIGGVSHWFELSIAPMQESDEHEIHYICLSRDITEAKKGDFALQKSEERYRGLLNNLDAGIVVYGSDISIIMCNSKASDLLGLSIEEILGRHAIDPYWEFLNEDNSVIDINTHPVSIIVNTHKPVKNFTLGINLHGSNSIAWVLVNGFPILDDQEKISEILISFIDITERKLMEIEIVEGRKQAESANKAKTDFLANMSHEIRTPLNGIIGFTHLLMKSNLEKNQLEYMNTVSESATTLMHIVNDVLDFSKVESGKLELNIEEVNLFELIKQVIDLFRYQAIQKNIKLTFTMGANVPEFVLADSIRLKQILVNLLSNALKFTNFGEITLDICETGIFKNDYLSIKFSVKDTGIGIKLDNNEKIFNSFVQEDNSTSRKFGGTGLGLTISNKLLALMDSKLHLHSKYGEGSDFYFEIKLKKITPKSDNELAMENSPVHTDSKPSKILDKKKVLIVEDNKINMLLAKTLVKRLITNCIIFEAKDGVEGVEMYIKEKPDVILMDIQMPNKNGYEATSEIRELEGTERTPIIAVTAGILTGEKEKCFEAGMDDYLPKPIIIADLESTLLKWLDK